MADGVLEKIPDTWYDIYGRLIPGTLFVSAVLFKFSSFPDIEKIASSVWILVAGFFVGHLMQPIAARFIKTIYWVFGTDVIRDKAKEQIDYQSRQALVLSKQHAEASGMISLSLFSLLLIPSDFLAASILGIGETTIETAAMIFPRHFGIAASIVFFLLALERIRTVHVRCKSYLNSPAVS